MPKYTFTKVDEVRFAGGYVIFPGVGWVRTKKDAERITKFLNKEK